MQQAISDLNLDYPEKPGKSLCCKSPTNNYNLWLIGYVKQKVRLFVIKKFDKEGVLVNVTEDSPDYKEKIVIFMICRVWSENICLILR